ncbi:Cytosol aminopeptidase PepA [Chitinispirillum alkaliphilum]|nr:Cytosol aminopeptidase PepA [Chitinispirillum alkaliphilum]
MDFSGNDCEITVRYEEETAHVYCGLGKTDQINPGKLRGASARGVQKAMELKRSKVVLMIPEEKWCKKMEATALVEGAILGSYRFVKYKSEKPPRIDTLEVVSSTLTLNDIKNTDILCSNVNYARDLVNENASVMTPEALAKEARSLGNTCGMKVTVLDEKELRRQKLSLIDAVGKGSPYPPRLIIIEYTANRKSKEKTAIIGKGITFDSGGQNLKPSGSIETMREDMAGSAAVLATMKCIGALKPKINVVGVIAAAHNAIGSNAYFPGDVYRSYSGKTVEICNTDAEGRLVLADAISYCLKKHSPSTIVDLATLTGGVLVALGDIVAGLFSNNDQLAQELFEAGESSGERLWRLPLYEEYSQTIKSDICDIRNLAKLKRGHASSIIGAAFLKEFVEECPWAHIDIAGTAFNEGGAKGEIPQFATGYGVRLLTKYLIK